MTKGTYMAIPPGAVIPGALPDFRIYMRTARGTYTLWAREGNKVTEAQLARLSEGGQQEIYVDLEEKFKYEQYLEDHLGRILENQAATDDQKAKIFSKVSANVVKGAFEASLGLGAMDAVALDRTKTLIENALVFIKEAESLDALAKMIGHDYQTYEHATKVLWLTVAFLKGHEEVLARIVPEYEDQQEEGKREILKQCGVAALLHDIGKVFVSRAILDKKEPLTETEWEIMKRHPLNGLAMLIDTKIPLFVRKAVLHHHEDFQGGGYPMGLVGEQITLLGRVLRIIDVFDAMTSRRPYKEAMPPMQAVRIMIGAPEGGDGQPPPDARDQGMQRSFDGELLREFIVFLGKAKF